MEKHESALVEALNKILQSQHEETQARLLEVDKLLVLHNAQLGEHMRRSEQNEEGLSSLKALVHHHQQELVIINQERLRQAKNSDRFWKIVIAVLTGILLKILL